MLQLYLCGSGLNVGEGLDVAETSFLTKDRLSKLKLEYLSFTKENFVCKIAFLQKKKKWCHKNHPR